MYLKISPTSKNRILIKCLYSYTDSVFIHFTPQVVWHGQKTPWIYFWQFWRPNVKGRLHWGELWYVCRGSREQPVLLCCISRYLQACLGMYLYLCHPCLCSHIRFLPVSSVQFSSVAQSCLTLCDPMNSSTPGLPVHHQLPEFTQTHVHRVGDATQPPHPLSSPSPPAPNPSQHQSLFQWVNSLHEVAKVLEFQL